MLSNFAPIHDEIVQDSKKPTEKLTTWLNDVTRSINEYTSLNKEHLTINPDFNWSRTKGNTPTVADGEFVEKWSVKSNGMTFAITPTYYSSTASSSLTGSERFVNVNITSPNTNDFIVYQHLSKALSKFQNRNVSLSASIQNNGVATLKAKFYIGFDMTGGGTDTYSAESGAIFLYPGNNDITASALCPAITTDNQTNVVTIALKLFDLTGTPNINVHYIKPEISDVSTQIQVDHSLEKTKIDAPLYGGFGTVTPNTALIADASSFITSSVTTSLELSYLSGVTSGVQGQLNGKEPTITAGLTGQYWRGDKTWQTLDTSVVPENTNLYYTDARARAAISETVTGLDYSSLTGVLSLTTGYVIPTTTEQSNWNNSHNKWVDIQRLGFVNNAQTSISFDDVTYIFTLTDLTGGSGWKYLYNGYEYTIIGNKTVNLPGTPPAAGVYYIYIDSTTGVLTQSVSVWSLLDSKVPVAVIYWNNALTPKYWLMDERHTCLIDSRDHYYEHVTRGTQYLSGGVLTGPDVTPAVPTDANNTYGISVTDIADEDLLWTLLALTRPNGITTDYVSFYRTSSTTWAWLYSAMPYYYTAAGYINYDNAGTMTQGTSGNYYNSYLLFTNLNGAARYIVINGRGQFASLTAAQAENPGTFDFTGLGIAEFVIAYQFTWRTLAAYGTKGKCRLEATPKRLNISLIGTSVSAPTTSHNSLSGLQGGLSPTEYYHLTNPQWILATQYASATQGGLLSSADWNTFNNKYPPAGNSAWTYAEGSANYNNRRVRSVAGTGSWRFNFSVPGDFVTLDGVYVVCFVSSGAVGAGKNIDFYVEYTNADNQSYNQYTASDTATTYNLTGYTDKQYRFDITALFTNLTANSEGGIFVDHATAIGGSLFYVGVLIRYH